MLQNLLFNLAQRTLNPAVRRRVEGTLVTTALVLFGLHLALYIRSPIGGSKRRSASFLELARCAVLRDPQIRGLCPLHSQRLVYGIPL